MRIPRRTPREIEEMRPVGRFVADVLEHLIDAAAPGVSLIELDELAHEMIRKAGATSCYIDYHPSFGGSPFGKVLCTSVNDAALHGLPFSYVLADGDLLSVDFAVQLNGWVADAARSTIVGTARAEDQRLIAATEAALAAGIDRARVGRRLGDISAAIGEVARSMGYPINTDFGGHGVGRTMHEEPSIPNDGRAGKGPKLEAGMVFAVEPWLMESTDEIVVDPDGWTLRSVDGSRAAHTEHTIVVTETEPVILTQWPSLR